MTPTVEQPCRRGLTPACFRQEPAWAKSAFALRLLHSILPPELSKKLPLILRRALIAPGVTMPAGIDPATLPPAILITQDTDFPPGWTPADPLPPEAIPPPAIPALDAPLAPPHLTASPGSDTPPTSAKTTSPPAAGWQAKFDDTHWERGSGYTQPNWDGSKWQVTANAEADLTVLGTWFVGYRPTHIRVTLDPGASSTEFLRLHATFPKVIVYEIPYASATELALTFGGGAGDSDWDITEIHFGAVVSGIDITNIEFYIP